MVSNKKINSQINMAEGTWKKWGGELLAFHFKQSGQLGILIISGELVTNKNGEVQESLMVALDNVDHLLVYFDQLGNVTDSFIRLLCSAHRLSRRANKRLTLIGSQKETLRKDVQDSKTLNISACIGDCANSCLWT